MATKITGRSEARGPYDRGVGILRSLRNLRRRLRRPPDFVSFLLEGEYPELPQRTPLAQRLISGRRKVTSLWELGEQFRTVAADPRVRGVVLHIRPLTMPQADLQTLRQMIEELRRSGKRVVTWSFRYATNTYLVACAADEIVMQNGGWIPALGLRGSFLFLKDALARVGLEGDFVQISPYKSAPDMLTRSEMSDEVRQMVGWLMDDQYEWILDAIAAGRGCDRDKAKRLVDSSPYTDAAALEAGVVDRLAAEEELPSILGSPEKPARILPWRSARKRIFLLRTRRGKQVAIVRIEGGIVDGRSQRPPIRPLIPVPLVLEERAGDLSVVQEVRRAMTDKRAAAVVLHVDSGGGSATASESMRQALAQLASKKPLVVHMGAAAASGGYWVSTPGRWIVAQPGTITGSIGVLDGKIVQSGLLGKLLINREVVSRGERALFDDPSRRFDDQERRMVWEFIERIYDLFLERVTASRGMTREQVDAIGKGRVWTGRQAKDRGLVDELGGLRQAVAKAREMAGLPETASVRVVRVRAKRELPPRADAAALLEYVFEGIELVNRSGALSLTPLVWVDGGS